MHHVFGAELITEEHKLNSLLEDRGKVLDLPHMARVGMKGVMKAYHLIYRDEESGDTSNCLWP